jgi:hypothetical protein
MINILTRKRLYLKVSVLTVAFIVLIVLYQMNKSTPLALKLKGTENFEYSLHPDVKKQGDGILVTWDTISHACYYRIERIVDSIPHVITESTDTNFLDTDINPTEQYTYKVTPLNCEREQLENIGVLPSHLIAQREITLTAYRVDAGVMVNWTSLPEACDYRLEREDITLRLKEDTKSTYITDGTNFLDENVIVGHRYGYRLIPRSCNTEEIPGVFCGSTPGCSIALFVNQ